MTPVTSTAIQVGISACLLGQKVRFDGGHKRAEFCEQELSRYFQFLPICPEVAIGLGVPRAAIRLVQRSDGVHVEASDGSFDVTEPLVAFAEKMSEQLGEISGYIFCAKSPSCGMERVRLYGEAGGAKEGVGLYARSLMQRLPLLPVEEDGRLNDPHLRENFVMRVFAYHDWQQLLAAGVNRGKLIAFHSRYKYLLLAHHPAAYKELGRYLAVMSELPLEHVVARYATALMAALKVRASRKNHSNVLQHLQGYFKRELSAAQKAELHETIDKYRRGILPLLAPMTLLRHYLREYPNHYLQQQVYLNPYPEELALRYGL
ncbi:MAG: YbgA family protein [Aeromonadaceae bacterium]